MNDINHVTLQYVATLREQLEQLAEERTPDGLPRSVWSLTSLFSSLLLLLVPSRFYFTSMSIHL